MATGLIIFMILNDRIGWGGESREKMALGSLLVFMTASFYDSIID
ncbi:MAG: hypothetical protein ACSLEM_05620 [Candidatus Malihini olakiniferum]